MALNTRRIEESVWAPPPGEVTTLVAVTAGTWPAGTRLLVGDPPDTPATATVLGSSVVSADGLTATWALSEADCAILRTHTRFMVQVPSGAAWEGILAGTVNLEPAWSGGRAVQRLGTVMVGPQGPAGTVADATSSVKGVVALAGDLAGTAAAPTVPGLAGKAAASHTHAAADITSGTVATARLGSGTASSTTYLRGDGTWATPGRTSINAQTGTTYTLVAGDEGKTVTLDNAAAITLNAPGSVFVAGARVDCIVIGAGRVTVVGTSGATVNGTPSLVSRAQWSAFSVLWLSATQAVVVGDLA